LQAFLSDTQLTSSLFILSQKAKKVNPVRNFCTYLLIPGLEGEAASLEFFAKILSFDEFRTGSTTMKFFILDN